MAKVNGVWHEAPGSAATTHIFKPGIAELKHQALVEHATMVAANELGVDVATSQLLQFEQEWAIVVSRFDRIADDYGVSRIHQEDFCQALRREPVEKYETHGGPGLRDMMRVVKQQSTARSDDVLALADFAAINLGAGAPDGHAKNISRLRVPQQRTIAPLYDLATGLAYDRGKVDRSIAVSIGGERFVSRIRRSQWLKAAQVLGLPADELRSRVAALAAGFPDAFGKALRAVEQAPGALEVAERALPRLEHHCDRIQAQL